MFYSTLSSINPKHTDTVHDCTEGNVDELCISTDNFLERILLALYPNTNNIESITLLFPLPFGPTIALKH